MADIHWATLAESIQEGEREFFLLSWADWREERGLAGAHGLRWLADNGRWPNWDYLASQVYFYLSLNSSLSENHHYLPDGLFGDNSKYAIKGHQMAEVILNAALTYEREQAKQARPLT